MKIHPLQDDSKPHGVVRFIHEGKQSSYSFCVNRMSGDMLDWFDNDAPRVNRTVGRIKNIIKSIEDKSESVTSKYAKF